MSEIVENSEVISSEDFQLCQFCGLLCHQLNKHLIIEHGTAEYLGDIVENSEVISSENIQHCQFCGLLCHQLNEHLIIEHGTAEYLGDIVEVHMQENPKTYKSKQHFCVYCQTLHFKLARHLENKHLLEEDVQEALRYNKEIQKKGDFLYNTRHEHRISQRRGYDNSPALIPCPYCKGYYRKNYLRNHSRSIMPCALPTANDILRSRIFPTMTENENYMSLINDDLGTKYGNYLTTKYSSSQHHDKMIKAKLRQLSRLFLEMKKLNQNIVNMISIFDSANFYYFIQAIYNMAGLKDGTVLETDTIVRKDEKMERDCKRFLILPKTIDIKELVDSLEIEIQYCKTLIKDEFNQQTWIILNKLVLIRIMVYKQFRKRPGDVEKSRMFEYENIEILNEEQIQHLQGSEKEADMEAIDLILKYRKSANVEDRNPYLFATPSGTAEQFFKGGKALKDFCIEKKFCHKSLTATNMRKYLATVTCTFGKEEQMQVSDFMGHAFNIHQNIYRQRPVSLDIVGMSKLLDYASGFEKQDATDRSSNISSNIPVLPEHKRLGGTSSEGPATSGEGIPATSIEGVPGTSREGIPGISTEEICGTSQTDGWLTPCLIECSDESECTSPKANEDDTSDEDFSPYSSGAGKSSQACKLQQRNYLEGHVDDIPSLETCQHFTFQNSVLSSRSTSQIRSWIVQEKKRRQSGSKSEWPTPLRNMCREKFRNFHLTWKYRSASEMLEVIRESPEHNLTVPKLRSHLQHDLKFASSQKMLGRKLF
ncbi:hypothetical protein WA026_022920 [Henosepilachna vigintioctopunctata]|uniref:C2H2-type domain-containing protein n=1 Tax=Henosepilachna vigintioctopunctata TaxID=420089 RepID=A0AAW1TXS5_9CUCU